MEGTMRPGLVVAMLAGLAPSGWSAAALAPAAEPDLVPLTQFQTDEAGRADLASGGYSLVDNEMPREPAGLFLEGQAAQAEPEAMVERSLPQKRLKLAPSRSGLFELGEEKDGFRTARIKKTTFWKGVLMDVPKPAAQTTAQTTAKTTAQTTTAPAGQKAAATNQAGKAKTKNPNDPEYWKDKNTDRLNDFYGSSLFKQKSHTCAAGVCTTQLVVTNEAFAKKYYKEVSHTYDQSKDYGTRNTDVLTAESGARETFSYSPLIFDLSGAGVRLSDRRVRFDIDGSGRRQRISDIASGAGILVFDSDGDGIAGEHGREVFGTATDLEGRGRPDGFADGFAALAAFLRRAEARGVLAPGTLAGGRLGPKELARLRRACGLGLRVGGLRKRTVSLEEAGVREILLSQGGLRRSFNFDGQGNDVLRQEGAVFVRADGSRGGYEDVFFAAQQPTFEKYSWKKL